MIITKTPFRITLAGGGTDLPSFYKNHGGIVATMAIDKHIYVNFKPNILDRTVRLQYLKTEIVEDTGMLEHERARESLIKHDIAHSIEISSMADLPSQSGLGSSGSYLVGLLNAIRTYKKMSCEPDLIAEEACEIEIETLKVREQYRKEFFGNVSHELKTPLFTVQGYILTLLDGAMNDEKIREKY